MRALAAGLALWAGAAQATLPPCAYDELVREATLVVQMHIDRVDGPDALGDCTVAGEVVRLLRDNGSVAVGQRARFTVACTNPQGFIGPQLYTPPEALRSHAFVEYHGVDGGGISGYGAGLVLLDAPTDAIAWTSECGG